MDPKDHLILFVDDEHASRVVFQQSFGKKFRVKCVDSGEKALDVLKDEPVAVLVTDQRMPGISGDELLERAKVLSPDTIRIVVTAYSDLEPILRAVNQGLVVRYIIKPWDRAELADILTWALEVFEIGRTSSAVQMRLVQTERVLTLGQVAAAVVHDLRQPLSSVNTNVDHLQRRAASLTPILEKVAAGGAATAQEKAFVAEVAAELPELAEDLVSGVAFMQGVVAQLAQFRERGVISEDPSDSDPVPLVRHAIAMCSREARDVGCIVVNDVPAELPRVKIAAVALLQILVNIVRNAQEAAGCRGRGTRVYVGAVVTDSTVRFHVRDDGPGMSPDVLAKIGTLFFTTRADGTGLGIAQVRRLVGAAGGTFEVDSVEGQGTTATFSLPRSAT